MIEFGHSSHVGLRREHNEDTYYGDGELGLWLVADGMGGHENGEVASALARDTMVREIRPAKALAQAIQRPTKKSSSTRAAAPRALADGHHGRRGARARRCATKSPGSATAASTVERRVASDLAGSLLRAGTDRPGRDHPEQARTHPHRNVVTQALGVTDPQSLKRRNPDRHVQVPAVQLLLCSDGLTEEVDDSDDRARPIAQPTSPRRNASTT
jgi:serine/threonine protein phosphatase PrpC